jgi:hypothetical protein
MIYSGWWLMEKDVLPQTGEGVSSPFVIPGRHEAASYSLVFTKGHENPFIVAAFEVGDNHLQARHIRNSISLTLARLHRIICAPN